MLRAAPVGTSEVLDTGNFALVPFCNRIRDGAFQLRRPRRGLAPNLGDHPHALHGQAWRGGLDAWSRPAKTEAVLAFDRTRRANGPGPIAPSSASPWATMACART